jgi:hypothetical protein
MQLRFDQAWDTEMLSVSDRKHFLSAIVVKSYFGATHQCRSHLDLYDIVFPRVSALLERPRLVFWVWSAKISINSLRLTVRPDVCVAAAIKLLLLGKKATLFDEKVS